MLAGAQEEEKLVGLLTQSNRPALSLDKAFQCVIIIRGYSRPFIGLSYGKGMRGETERMRVTSPWDEVCIMHWNSHTVRVGQGTLCAEEEDERSV